MVQVIEDLEEVNIILRKGKTFTYQVTRNDVAGNPVDNTAHSGFFQARTNLDDVSAIIDLSGAAVVGAGATGVWTVTQAATATALLTAAEIFYEFFVDEGSGVKSTLGHGVLTIKETAGK